MMGDCEIVPELFDADFAVICEGDSMINYRIFNGDVIYARYQRTVEDGHIAIVIADGKIYMGQIQNKNGYFVLTPGNPKYRPYIFDIKTSGAILVGQVVGASISFE